MARSNARMEVRIMKLYKAPEATPEIKDGEVSVFLAGSRSAENWQAKLEQELSEFDNVVVYNPRRDYWDSSWAQDPTPGTKFHQQVAWGLEHINKADLVVIYFANGSMSPITLLEFGLLASDLDNDIVVYCTPEFYRYGNVQMVADNYFVPLFSEYDEFIHYIKSYVSQA